MKEESEIRPATDDGEKARGVDRRSVLRGGLTGLTVLGSGVLGSGAAMAGETRPLVLHHDGLRVSVAELFALANEDAEIRQLLLENPSRVILEAILPKGTKAIPAQRLSEANRFLMSVLANDGFRKWAAAYQATLSSTDPRTIDKLAVAQDVAAAFGKYGDTSLTVSLANQTSLDAGPQEYDKEVEVSVETYIVAVAVLVLVIVLIDFNVENKLTAAEGRMTPAELRSIADQLVNQAKQKHTAGRLADPRASIP